jgi:RNA polymerase sigma-70 factor (ECF subfamily)
MLGMLSALVHERITSGAQSDGDRVPARRTAEEDVRLRTMLDEHFDFIWRQLRRFGLSADHADDAAQQVFFIASRKLGAIAIGSERSFLFGTAMRVASDLRRSASYRREIAHEDPAGAIAAGDAPDELLDRQRARALLDTVLESLEADLRTVFILFELEEMTTSEIAALLELPQGTVASRLRRAREEFQARIERLKRGGWR